MTLTPDVFATPVHNSWCPGCGNFSILGALRDALVALDLPPHRIAICSGIGQAAKVPHLIKCNGFNGLHGRALPVAVGVKLAAGDLTVLVPAGDGDCYGEGCNHLIHAIRRNVDVTVVVHDNRIYGLTKGQSSPTTPMGQKTSSEKTGVRAAPLNPLALALSQRCSFVAQAFTGDRAGLTDILCRAIRHRGFSLVNVLQPCVSFNKVHTFSWFKQHTYPLPSEWDDGDLGRALTEVMADEQRLPLGVLYRHERPTFDALALDGLSHPLLRDRPLDPTRVVGLFEEFR